MKKEKEDRRIIFLDEKEKMRSDDGTQIKDSRDIGIRAYS